MTERERQGWIIVASLFVVLVFVFGSGYNTGGLFFAHLLKYFGWPRAQLSTLQGLALPISAGLAAPLIGWLLDRVEARVVMVAGVIMTGTSFLIASRVDSFGPLFGAYVLLGVGIGASTLLPCSLVIANWFGARRGLAMGLAFAGTSLGGAAMTMVGNFAIARGGWRAGYIALAVPMFVVVIPLIIIVVRTRPPQAEGVSVARASDALPGFELREAIRSRSFWMICRGAILFRRRLGRRGAASDHLPHRTRLHAVVLGRHDEPGAGVRGLRQARDGPVCRSRERKNRADLQFSARRASACC